MRAKTVGGSSIRRPSGMVFRSVVGGVAPGGGRRRPVDADRRATAGDTGRRARVSRRPEPQRPRRPAHDRHGLPAGRAGVDVAPRGFQGAWAARATDVGGLADVPSTVRAARRGHRDDRRRAGPEDGPRADECVHPASTWSAVWCGLPRRSFVSGNPSISRTRSNTSWSKSTASTSAGRQGAGWRACSETQSSVFETARAIAIGRVVAREVAQWGVDR